MGFDKKNDGQAPDWKKQQESKDTYRDLKDKAGAKNGGLFDHARRGGGPKKTGL